MMAKMTDRGTARLPPVDRNGITPLEVPDVDKMTIPFLNVFDIIVLCKTIQGIPRKCQCVCMCVRLFSTSAALVAACQRLVRRCLRPRVAKKKHLC